LGTDGVEDVAVNKTELNIYDDEDQFSKSKAADRMRRWVEDLYYLLPAIRSLRREQFLLVEERKSLSFPMTLMSTAKNQERQPAKLVPPSEDAELLDWVEYVMRYNQLLISYLFRNDMSNNVMLERENEMLNNWGISVLKDNNDGLPTGYWEDSKIDIKALAAIICRSEPNIEFDHTDFMNHSINTGMGRQGSNCPVCGSPDSLEQNPGGLEDKPRTPELQRDSTACD
jgi:hypothetical protein